MPEGFSFDDYSERQIYAMVRIAEKLNGEPKIPNPRSAWKASDYALYNHIAKDIRDSRAAGLVYDPYGVSLDLD